MRTAARKGMMVSNRMWYLRCGRKLVCEGGTQDPPLHETKAQEWGTQNRQRGEKSDMARHGLFGLASLRMTAIPRLVKNRPTPIGETRIGVHVRK
jgi:hypothetical protein